MLAWNIWEASGKAQRGGINTTPGQDCIRQDEDIDIYIDIDVDVDVEVNGLRYIANTDVDSMW